MSLERRLTSKIKRNLLRLRPLGGHFRIVSGVTKNGVNSQIKNQGKTPLVSAISQDYSGIVESFLKGGITPNSSFPHERTGLMMAAERRELDMTSCFLELETDVNLRDNKGVTALMWASYQGYFDI